MLIVGASRWLNSKDSACNAGDTGWIPGSGRYPGGENGSLFQCSWDNPMGREEWRAMVQGLARRQTRLSVRACILTVEHLKDTE